MSPDSHEEALKWLIEAREDVSAAEHLRSGNHYSHACFHSQQAAEKALKAFLYEYEVEEPWGHSLVTLLEEAATYDNTLLEPLYRVATILDRFYIPTRYPNGLPGGLPSKSYHEDDADQTIRLAKKIIDAIHARIE